MHKTRLLCVLAMSVASGLALRGQAQGTPPQAQSAPQPPAAGRGRGGPSYVSPQIQPDGRVTFRLLAPRATSVTVTGDVAGGLVPAPGGSAPAPAPPGPAAQGGQGGRGGPPVVVMTRGDNGLWEGTTARAIKPGAWRYAFDADGT